jgi:methionine-rich copper-binding protein CopC
MRTRFVATLAVLLLNGFFTQAQARIVNLREPLKIRISTSSMRTDIKNQWVPFVLSLSKNERHPLLEVPLSPGAQDAAPFDSVPPLFALPSTADNPVRLAHAILVKANPAQDATLTDVPEDVLLIFNDAVGQEFLALAVIDPSGKRVDNHDAKLDFTDHSHLRASVSKLAPGRYTVRYRVLSADGHVVSGKYFLT